MQDHKRPNTQDSLPRYTWLLSRRPNLMTSFSGTFDGLVLFAAHELLTSQAALDHLLSHIKDQGGIVAFGAKLNSGSCGRLLNPLLYLVTRTLLPRSSAPLDKHPWRLLEERTGTLHMQECIGGFFYLVWGSLHRTPA